MQAIVVLLWVLVWAVATYLAIGCLCSAWLTSLFIRASRGQDDYGLFEQMKDIEAKGVPHRALLLVVATDSCLRWPIYLLPEREPKKL